jgi:hypothetical protein
LCFCRCHSSLSLKTGVNLLILYSTMPIRRTHDLGRYRLRKTRNANAIRLFVPDSIVVDRNMLSVTDRSKVTWHLRLSNVI